MKNQIKLSALVLLLSTGLFAATANAKTLNTSPQDDITLTVQADQGVDVSILKQDEGEPVVTVYDNENHVLLTDYLPNKANITRGYDLSDLDSGDYTIEVTSNNDVVTKTVHIDYNDDAATKTISIAD